MTKDFIIPNCDTSVQSRHSKTKRISILKPKLLMIHVSNTLRYQNLYINSGKYNLNFSEAKNSCAKIYG